MNLIFDLDGTICDSFNTFVEIAKKQYPQYVNSYITPQKARDLGLKELIKQSKIPKTKIPLIIISGRKEIAKHIPKLKIFPEMKSVIKKLSQNHVLGIITTNSTKNAKLFLKNNNIDQCFDFVYSSSDFFGKNRKLNRVISKYKLNPSETFYIGDETRDIEAAKKVGIKSVAVTWGFESKKILKNAGPDLLVINQKDLLKLFI